MKQTQAGATFGDCEGMVHPHLTVMVDLTAEDATALVRRIGQVYPGVIAAVAREMSLGPTLEPRCGGYPEPVYRGGCGFDDPEFAEGAVIVGEWTLSVRDSDEPCDLHCADPEATSCECCQPSLHAHDCCACDGKREVTDR